MCVKVYYRRYYIVIYCVRLAAGAKACGILTRTAAVTKIFFFCFVLFSKIARGEPVDKNHRGRHAQPLVRSHELYRPDRYPVILSFVGKRVPSSYVKSHVNNAKSYHDRRSAIEPLYRKFSRSRISFAVCSFFFFLHTFIFLFHRPLTRDDNEEHKTGLPADTIQETPPLRVSVSVFRRRNR